LNIETKTVNRRPLS